MKTYELTYIISPEITSEEAESFSKEIEFFIKNSDGAVLNQTNPAAKILAYRISGHASGFAGSAEFQMEAEKLHNFKKMLDEKDNILRHIIVIKKPQKKKDFERKEKNFLKLKKDESLSQTESKTNKEQPEIIENQQEEVLKSDKKVELKDIEQKLDELLNQ